MAATKTEALCPAKINLTFDIKGRRADDYHEVETLLQAVSLYDRLVFTCCPDKPFAVKIKSTKPAVPGFPLGEDNIIYAAAAAFRQHLPRQPDFELEVAAEKNIPAGAGLGGGSSNAAAVLAALNAVFDEPFDADELAAIGRSLGADVPFFIAGGMQLGTARGDELQQLKPPPESLNKPTWFVLVKPREISVFSKWAYAEYDRCLQEHNTAPRPDWQAAADILQRLPKAHEPQQYDTACFGNVFEPIILACYPALAKLKNAVESAGAICCNMTGSGSALYGLAASEKHAHNIAGKLSSSVIADADIFVVQSIEHGVQLRNINEESCAAKY